MADLNDMALFAQVVEARGFSAAARRSNASPSRLSKAVKRLEQALGARLLNRNTRGLRLTETGESFYRHCRAMLEEAEKAMEAVREDHGAPQGVLRVSAPTAFGMLHLSRVLPDLLAEHPALRVHLTLDDTVPDLVAGGHDVLIVCAAQPPERSVARPIASVPRGLFAAPSYLASRGVPQAPADLARYSCLHGDFAGPALWRLQSGAGETVVSVRGPLRADSEVAIWHAARAGIGIAQLPLFLAEEDLTNGRLVAVLPTWRPPEERLFALRLPGPHVPARVRVLIDFLVARFGDRRQAPRARAVARASPSRATA